MPVSSCSGVYVKDAEKWLLGRRILSRVSSQLDPAGSPSRAGDVAVYVKVVHQSSVPTPFDSVPVSISVFMALSTVFHSTNSPDDCPFSHSVLPVLFLPYASFQLYISLLKSPFSPDVILCG